MGKKISRIIATIMLVIAAIFIWYALNHPETSWSVPLSVVRAGYGLYFVGMIVLFIAPFKKK